MRSKTSDLIRFKCELPFTGVFAFKMNYAHGRMGVRIYEDDGTKRVMNYSRYLMCVKEKRILDTKEDVHHIDGDKSNDVISNLRIMDKKSHSQLHNPTIYVRLVCPNCLKDFEIIAHQYRENVANNNRFMTC